MPSVTLPPKVMLIKLDPGPLRLCRPMWWAPRCCSMRRVRASGALSTYRPTRFTGPFPSDPPFTENTPLAPRSPYAASKAASDHLALAYAHTFLRNAVIVTAAPNNDGPYQFPES